jgi:molybdopterin synthase sulfur carrier subunit
LPRVVTISGRVADFTGGVSAFEVEARTVRSLIRELEARYPGLGEFVEEQMALAIDGEIFQDALGAEIGADSEIVLIPKISGG